MNEGNGRVVTYAALWPLSTGKGGITTAPTLVEGPAFQEQKEAHQRHK